MEKPEEPVVSSQMPLAMGSKWALIRTAPLVFQAFLIFSLCAPLVECWFLVREHLFSTSQPPIPRAGRFVVRNTSNFGIVALLAIETYLMPLFMVYKSLDHQRIFKRMLGLAVKMLMFFAMLTLYFSIVGRAAQGRQPWVAARFILPFFWAAIFYSPAMRSWMQAVENGDFQQSQSSITDLFYLTTAAAIATAIGLALAQVL